jgi:hypothetical protein
MTQAPAVDPGRAGHTDRRWLLGGVWTVCVLFLCTAAVADPDLWGHTLYGLRSIDNGVLTERNDPFSYTAPGADWINHEWLTEYQFGWLWRCAGNPGLVMWRNLLVAGVFVVAALAIRRAGASLAAAVLLLILNAECLSNYVIFVRPQLATYALFAAYLHILRVFHEEPASRSIGALPPLMAVWVNLHGGFLAGGGLVVLFLVAALVRWWRDPAGGAPALKRLWCVTVLVALATLVNPYGIGLHKMLWHHLWTEQFVREWQPLWDTRQTPVYYVPFMLTGIALFGLRRWKLVDALVLAVVSWQAAMHLRHVALFSIATLVLLPGPMTAALQRLFPLLTERWGAPEGRIRRRAAVCLAAGFLIVLQFRSGLEFRRQGIGPWQIGVETRSQVPGMPLRALAALSQAQLSGNLVTDYGWGQFVLWHLHPGTRVAFDGRYRTVFPPLLERQFLQFQKAQPGVDPRTPMLDEYPTELALVPTESGTERYLDSRTDWVRVYRDDQASVFMSVALRQTIKSEVPAAIEVATVPRWCVFPGRVPTGTKVASGDRDQPALARTAPQMRWDAGTGSLHD